MAKVRIGSSYLLKVNSSMMARLKSVKCRECKTLISKDSFAVGKRRGNQRAKYYCVSCALALNIITLTELRNAMFKMGLEPTFALTEVVLAND